MYRHPGGDWASEPGVLHQCRQPITECGYLLEPIGVHILAAVTHGCSNKWFSLIQCTDTLGVSERANQASLHHKLVTQSQASLPDRLLVYPISVRNSGSITNQQSPKKSARLSGSCRAVAGQLRKSKLWVQSDLWKLMLSQSKIIQIPYSQSCNRNSEQPDRINQPIKGTE